MLQWLSLLLQADVHLPGAGRRRNDMAVQLCLDRLVELHQEECVVHNASAAMRLGTVCVQKLMFTCSKVLL